MSVAPERSGTARRPAAAPDVVACMPDGPLAGAVARAAVREAVRRGARVRFLQVLRAGVGDQERAAADDRTFSAALRALREAPRVRVTFETAEGDAEAIVVDRSRQAGVLVVAGGAPTTAPGRLGGPGGGHRGAGGIAEYCRGHADCPVLVVER